MEEEPSRGLNTTGAVLRQIEYPMKVGAFEKEHGNMEVKNNPNTSTSICFSLHRQTQSN